MPAVNVSNIIMIRAKTPEALEEMLANQKVGFNVISIYGMGDRHYAWLSLQLGVKKKVVKAKVRVQTAKQEKIKL